MKRLFALTLALIMVLSLATVAFADDVSGVGDHASETGSITINGASTESNTYKLYKMLLLESYNTASGAYSYKAENDWKEFLASADAAPYMATDTDGYVTWIWTAPTNLPEDDTTTPRTEAEAKAKFAKLAMAYAERKDLTPQRTTANSGDYVNVEGGIMFEDLTLGYYLIDSTMGALCGLTTTNPNAAINAKNAAPTIDKQVKEDSTNNWGSNNTADIGQTVDFMTTINVHAGAQNYVLHDTMSVGLTFDPDSVSVEHRETDIGKTETVPAAQYSVVTGAYDGCDKGCTFHVVFTQEFCDHLDTNDKVIVYYSAMLNRNATIAGDGNNNETFLEFGEEHTTTTDSTNTKTFGFDLVKTDSQGIKIDGAKFRIYSTPTGYTTGEGENEVSTEIDVVILKDKDEKPVLDGNDNPIYRRARANEDGVEIEVKGGIVTLVGFDNGTYYLEETEAPDGYNKLTGRQAFTIADGNLTASFDQDGKISAGSGVQVVNKTGSMLPETGAMGTVLFISFGTFVALGTGTLLVTKKRMSMIED